MTDIMNRRYYRGYSLLHTSEGWEIWWGHHIETCSTVESAEEVIDAWLNAA